MRKASYYIISSVYLNFALRERILGIIENIRHTRIIQDTTDVDMELLVTHCTQAKKMSNRKFYLLFVLFLIECGIYLFAYYETFILLTCILMLIAYATVVYEEISWKKFVCKQIKDKEPEQIPVKKINRQLVDLALMYRSSSIYYYKNYYPYSGFGSYMGGWSLPVDITRAKDRSESYQITEFQELELYDAITKGIENLNFKNVSISDCLLVNAHDIADEKLFFSNSVLVRELDLGLQDRYLNSKQERGRFYKMIRVKDWHNEFVFSILFRIYRSEENLFLEVKFFISPALKVSLKGIDKLKKRIRFKDVASIMANSLVTTPILLIASPFVLLANVIRLSGIVEFFRDLFGNEESEKELIGSNHIIDRLFRDQYYGDYFQSQDADFYLKTVEKRVLNTIIDFLEDHNINVSDFKESVVHILNNGIMMSGGELKADNVAIGNKSKIQATVKE
ncbi:hypothetical protein ACTHGU_05260 [Chitinophagaceae bacterium MMS25-I14]